MALNSREHVKPSKLNTLKQNHKGVECLLVQEATCPSLQAYPICMRESFKVPSRGFMVSKQSFTSSKYFLQVKIP